MKFRCGLVDHGGKNKKSSACQDTRNNIKHWWNFKDPKNAIPHPCIQPPRFCIWHRHRPHLQFLPLPDKASAKAQCHRGGVCRISWDSGYKSWCDQKRTKTTAIALAHEHILVSVILYYLKANIRAKAEGPHSSTLFANRDKDTCWPAKWSCHMSSEQTNCIICTLKLRCTLESLL